MVDEPTGSAVEVTTVDAQSVKGHVLLWDWTVVVVFQAYDECVQGMVACVVVVVVVEAVEVVEEETEGGRCDDDGRPVSWVCSAEAVRKADCEVMAESYGEGCHTEEMTVAEDGGERLVLDDSCRDRDDERTGRADSEMTADDDDDDDDDDMIG